MTPLVMPDAELAELARPSWVEDMAKAYADDDSDVGRNMHALIGALRHAREQLAIAEVNLTALQRQHRDQGLVLQIAERSLSQTAGELQDAKGRLELGREHVRRGRTLFVDHPDGTRADFKLGLSMLLDHLETALQDPAVHRG